MTTTTILTNPPAPGSEDWKSTISASKIPPMMRDAEGNYAGLGYLTAHQQYEQIKGRFTEKHSPFMLSKFTKAQATEKKAAEWWITQQDNPADWTLSDGEVAYLSTDDRFNTTTYRIIATIDYVATNTTTREQVGLECKHPDAPGVRAQWIIQTLAQKTIANLDRHELIVYPAHGDAAIYPITHGPEAQQKLIDDVNAFITRLETNDTPDPDTFALDDLTMNELATLEQEVADAQAKLAAYKDALVDKMGAHKQATHGDKVIITRAPGRFAQSRLPKDLQKIAKEDRFKKTTSKFDEKLFQQEYPDAYAAATADSIVKFL